MRALGIALIVLTALVFIALVILSVIAIWFNDGRFGGLATLAFFVMFAPGISGALTLSASMDAK